MGSFDPPVATDRWEPPWKRRQRRWSWKWDDWQRSAASDAREDCNVAQYVQYTQRDDRKMRGEIDA